MRAVVTVVIELGSELLQPLALGERDAFDRELADELRRQIFERVRLLASVRGVVVGPIGYGA